MRAAFEIGACPGVSFLCDDGNNAANGVRAIKQALRTTQNFDAFNVGDIEIGEVEPALRRRCAIEDNPVDDDQRLSA